MITNQKNGKRQPGISTESGVLSMFTIYFNPSDFPDKYVVRLWKIIPGFQGPVPTKEHWVADTLENARKLVPPHLFVFPRVDGDIPCVVETWM